MIRRVFPFLFLAAGIAVAAVPVSAHHGNTNYDMKQTIVLTGTITNFDWANPHCLAHVDVADDAGNVRHWTLELNSTIAMSHHGWDKNTLKRGDRVSVETHPARNGAPIGITSGPGFALKFVANGRELPAR